MKVDFVISVNVYCSPPTLNLQLQSIQENVKGSYVVILNLTPEFLHCLPPLPENVVVNPQLISKRRYHGSILQGIVSNMQYAVARYEFHYFMVLSGRTIFYRPMDLDGLKRKAPDKPLREMGETPNDWNWNKFKSTLLAKHYLSYGFRLQGSMHEGLCFGAPASRTIVAFLNKYRHFAEDLYNKETCVEEFALQTIASIESTGFLYLGNGCALEYNETNPDLYTRKIVFLEE
jgi:hypothetical protein